MSTENSDLPNVPVNDDLCADGESSERFLQCTSRNTSKQGLVWLWLVANVLGFAIATPLSFLMNLSTQNFESLFVAGLIVGAIVGPLQAWVLKRQLPKLKAWQWIIANILGSYIGSWGGLLTLGILFILLESVVITLGDVTSWLLIMAIYGMSIGSIVSAAQLVSLRRCTQHMWPWWVASCFGRTLGWLSAGTVGWVIVAVMPETDTFLVTWGILLGAIGGAVYALVTAKALLDFQPAN